MRRPSDNFNLEWCDNHKLWWDTDSSCPRCMAAATEEVMNRQMKELRDLIADLEADKSALQEELDKALER